MPKQHKKSRKAAAKPAQSREATRRDMLRLCATAPLVWCRPVVSGYGANASFTAYAQEHALSRLGQGTHVIVQVHDPQCPTCTALQKQTRAAFKSMDDCGTIYLVADITINAGAALAARHGVPHVTLLFFDGQGVLLRRAQGMHRSAALRPMVAQHKAITQA